MAHEITVVVCTRDRPDDMQRCLASLLRLKGVPCQVVIVDQSQDDETQRRVGAMAGSTANVECVASGLTGLSVARNQGAERARGEVLLFTDDDCEVAEDWVEQWRQFFGAEPSVGVAFGLVTAPPFDPSAGHVPHFDPGGTRTWGPELLRRGASCVGMGANLAVRRDAWASVGGFDEGLGAGARFPAAEEIDLTLRILRAGPRAGHAQAPTVVHHGFRETKDASRLVQGYATGTAAMYMKHVRSGDRRAAGLMALEVGRLGWRVTRGLATGTRPLGLNSLRAFLRASIASRREPIDAARRAYRPYVAAASLEPESTVS